MSFKNIRLSERKIKQIFSLLLIVISGWIFTCAWLIEGEYGDGYSTITNARFLFGESETFFFYRGPIAAFILWPVEVAVQFFEFHPLDVRPYHFYSAFLHILYLYFCWVVLRKLYGVTSFALIAFVCSVVTVTFISYSPYLSHDIIPGVIFLFLIIVVEKWLRSQEWKWALIAVLLGALVTLIKQTYVIFWFSIIVALVAALVLKRPPAHITKKKFFLLIGFASISALISWSVYAFFVKWQFPEVSWWIRPLKIIDVVSNHYSSDHNYTGNLKEIFPWNLYWLNLHNYGVVAMLLIAPGLYYSFRSKNLLVFMVAVCWLVCFIIMSSIQFKEVRYLAFLAPLTAIIIAPIIRKIIESKFPMYLVLGTLMMLDVSRFSSLAIATTQNAGKLKIRNFLSPVDSVTNAPANLFMSPTLTFSFMNNSPLTNDRYHGLYHLTAEQISGLYQGNVNVFAEKNMTQIDSRLLKNKDVFLYSNFLLVRAPPWKSANTPVHSEKLIQFVGEVVEVELKREVNGFRILNSQNEAYYLLSSDKTTTKNSNKIIKGSINVEIGEKIFGEQKQGTKVKTLGVAIHTFCRGNNCD